MEWATPTLVMPMEDSGIELHTNDVSTTLACHSLIDYPVGVGFIARGCPGGLDNYCPKREKDSIVLTRHADLGLAGPWLGGAMKLQYLFLPEYDDYDISSQSTLPQRCSNTRRR